METIKPKTLEYYDLSEIMKTMESNGYMKERKFWLKYVTEWGVSNGTYFWLGFDYYSHTDKEEDFKEYFDEVNRLLGLPKSNDGIMVKVSW